MFWWFFVCHVLLLHCCIFYIYVLHVLLLPQFLCCNVTFFVIKGAFQTKFTIRWLIPYPIISLLVPDAVNVIHIFVAFLYVYELKISSVPTCRSLQWPVKDCSLFLNSSASQFFCCFIRQRNQFIQSDLSLSDVVVVGLVWGSWVRALFGFFKFFKIKKKE